MKIGVLMGGISSEREISLLSGAEVLKNLNKDKYLQVIPIVIDSKSEAIEKLKGIDFAFIALHGQFGEDGTIQCLLEAMEIPYSGSGVITSAICMNKSLTKTIIKNEGIKTAPWLLVNSLEAIDFNKIKEIGYPVFIKPNNGGSSVATYFISKEVDVAAAVKEGLKYDKEVLIEKYISGEEISSTMLNGEVFPTVSIKPKKGQFFDYQSKYEENGSEETIVYFDKNLQTKINQISKKIWHVLGCKGYSRIDMIIHDGIPYFLEVNTLPGLTPASIIPKSTAAKGISFSELLDKIIEYSMLRS